MELNNCIKNRRSIRKYLDKDVSWNLISKLIEAAHYAPSSGNIQNWRFIIIKDKEKREKIAEVCLNQLWMTEAPVFIVICSDNSNIKLHYEKSAEKFIHENCAAAIQNLMLKAYDLKLGSCWIGSFNSEIIERIIESEGAEIIAIITIGYPAEKPISKRHKIEELTFFETYGNRKRDVSLFPLEKHQNKIKKTVSKIKKKLKK